MKKTLIILLSAALLLTVLSGCSKKRESGQSADLPQKVTIGTLLAINPEAVAIPEDWLTEALGVEVDIVYFDAGRDINTAMASGSIDFGAGVGSPPAALAVANGIPCEIIYVHSVIGDEDALVVRSNLGIKDAQGLVGHRIATIFSSTVHYSLTKYLEVNNVNPSDVDIIDMRAGDIVEAFIQGNIDGAFTWEPNVTNMKNNGGVVLTSAREMADRGYATMNVATVRTEFAEKYPGLVRAYVRTMDRAVALLRNDPKTAGAAMARFMGLTEEECLAQAASAVWLTVSEQRSMRWAGSSALANSMYNTAMFLYEQGIISDEPSIEIFQQGVTNRYLDSWEGN